MSLNKNIDTKFTKIYVGGLPWKTREEGLIKYFEPFGEIVHANVILDRATNRSQGYGFVTFRDAESAARACINPNPLIEGRVANCKLAYNGATVNQNPSNIISLPPDDLCFVPYWNQFYHHQQQYYDFSQQCYYYPQYYDPVVVYQQYHLANMNQWYYWPHDSTTHC